VGNYKYLFVPVPSRRFGRSLGVDLTPYKTCSPDFVFCQLGRASEKTITRQEYVPLEMVLFELEDWLKKDGRAQYITLSGSGEPTLHSRFGEVLEFINNKSTISTAVLTNGTMLHLPEVRHAAALANVVKVSLSAWNQIGEIFSIHLNEVLKYLGNLIRNNQICTKFKNTSVYYTAINAKANSMTTYE